MRIDGIRNRSELAGYYRDARAEVERISVRPSQVAPYEAQGWETAEVLATKVRMKRPRTLDTLVELQAWRVLYLCGFPHLSGAGGAVLVRGEDVKNQLDAVAYDENAGVVVECKSSVGGASNVDVQAALAVLNDNRAKVREVLNLARARGDKLKVGGILVLYNVPFTDADKRRAAELKLTILDSSVLSYYHTCPR